MDCPQCGGPCYDNRQKKASGAYKPGAPDFACKDKENCGWKKFPPKGQKPAQSGNGTGARVSGGPLAPLYFRSMEVAAASVKKVLGDKATAADVISATATLFIAASEGRGPLFAPKPRPEPEPEPEPEDNDADTMPF